MARPRATAHWAAGRPLCYWGSAMPDATARARARDAFARRFGRAPGHVVAAPGRVELLGNHTDYNDGLVLSAAIDRELAMAVGRRADGRLCLRSIEEDGEALLYPGALDPARLPPWARYPAGVVAGLLQRGLPVPGMDALVASDIPAGAGLASSAALEVATALAVRALRPFRLARAGGPALDDAERWEIAGLCRTAEREFAGVPCGLLDQVSVLFGAPGAALLLDCRVPSVERLALPGLAIVVCDSGERHALARGEYAVLAAACTEAARALGVPALRDARSDAIATATPPLPPRAAACARHVVNEIARVAQAAANLRAGDVAALGQLMRESHLSSRTLLGNSTPALDLLVELALAGTGCLGARLTGGGFGGAIVALARADAGDALRRALPERFRERTGRTVHAWAFRPAGVVGGDTAGNLP